MATSIFAAPQRGNKPLVECRAGKMIVRGKTVSADPRKGLIQLEQTADNLMHFRWKDRTTGNIDTDLIIFPDEASFKRIRQCTTGRVYLLEWKTTARRMFFWMQEPNEDKDEDICTKINQHINNPPGATTQGGASTEHLNQAQLMQMMQQGGTRRAAASNPASAPSAAAGATAPSSGGVSSAGGLESAAISQDFLQSVLTRIGVSGQEGGSAQSRNTARQQRRDDTDLNDVMDPDALLPILENPAIQQQLMQFLPEGNRNPEEIQQLLRSPQFAQAVGALNAAIQSGELSELLPHFGLPISAVGGTEGGVNALIQALSRNVVGESNKQEQKEASQEQKKEEETKQQEDNDKMNVDTAQEGDDEDELPPLILEKKEDDKKNKGS